MFTKTAKTYYNIEKILKWKMNEWINELMNENTI